MTPIIDLGEWRRRRAESRAIDGHHPSVTGGPHADTLEFINRQLVPQGYRAGLWRAGLRTEIPLAHAVMPLAPGYAATRCNLTLAGIRRAEPDVLLCRACFPS